MSQVVEVFQKISVVRCVILSVITSEIAAVRMVRLRLNSTKKVSKMTVLLVLAIKATRTLISCVADL